MFITGGAVKINIMARRNGKKTGLEKAWSTLSVSKLAVILHQPELPLEFFSEPLFEFFHPIVFQ